MASGALAHVAGGCDVCAWIIHVISWGVKESSLTFSSNRLSKIAMLTYSPPTSGIRPWVLS